jgi:hypothetical protein
MELPTISTGSGFVETQIGVETSQNLELCEENPFSQNWNQNEKHPLTDSSTLLTHFSKELETNASVQPNEIIFCNTIDNTR